VVPAAFGRLGNAVGLGGSQLPAGESAPNTAGGYKIIFGTHIQGYMVSCAPAASEGHMMSGG